MTKHMPHKKLITEQVYGDEQILEKIVSIFYMDYKVFNITIPEYVNEFLRRRNIKSWLACEQFR